MVIGIPELAGDLTCRATWLVVKLDPKKSLDTYKNLTTRNARGYNSVTNFVLIAIRLGGINVAIANAQSSLDSHLDLVWLGLLHYCFSAYCIHFEKLSRTYPGSETNGGHWVARIESECSIHGCFDYRPSVCGGRQYKY